MADRKQRITLDNFSGGRNGADPPLGPMFGPTQVTDAVNVDWHRTTGGRKRYGSSNTSMAGSGLTGVVSWLGRHVPGTSDADAELWTVDEASPAIFQRLDNSTAWAVPAAVTDLPAIGAHTWEMTSVSGAGKFYISYDSNVGRLHVYDPLINQIRRVGIAPGSTAPTAANTGGGAYAATLRYYRVRWQVVSGSTVILQSEATPSVSFTPSGAGSAARVTRPALPANEYITHWILEASPDGVTFYKISNPTVTATTFIDDVNTVASLPGFTVSELTGTYSVPGSYRLIAGDQNRLIGWGSWVSTDLQNRMVFSSVFGSRNIGDLERVDTTTLWYEDFDENDAGPPTALMGPVWGNFYAFKSRAMYEVAPTGSTDQPFRKTALSKELGCVGSHAACRGEDEKGNPCLYIMTHRGFVRYGLNGFDHTIGRGIEDLILGPTSTMNMAATKVIAHMVFYPDLHQVWVWFATGSSNDPDTLCVLNVRTGGWARYTGSLAAARCSVMFANSIGASMGFALVPYIGASGSNNKIVKAADSAVTQDAGTNYQAYVTTKPIEIPGYNVELGDALVLAPVASGVTLTATITPDFGAQPTQTGTALLTASGSETRVTKRFEGSALAGAQFMQLQIGDSAAVSNSWSFDRVMVPIKRQEAVSA